MSSSMNPFGSPDAIAKLCMNSKTANYMTDPHFRSMLTEMSTDPQKLGYLLCH